MICSGSIANLPDRSGILILVLRELVQDTYIPPQIPDDVDIADIAEQYLYDFRRVFIEHPRLRLDGVYIAVCHYM